MVFNYKRKNKLFLVPYLKSFLGLLVQFSWNCCLTMQQKEYLSSKKKCIAADDCIRASTGYILGYFIAFIEDS